MAIMGKGKGSGTPPERGPERPQTRIAAQVDLILAGLEGSEAVYPPGGNPADGPAYLAHSSRLLVRDADVPRVNDAIERYVRTRDDGKKARRSTEPATGDVAVASRNGLTRLPRDSRLVSNQEALDAVDAELGRGVLTPDHVFYVTAASSCCPAKEPEPAAAGQGPVPAVRAPSYPSCCDGAGALVSVIDTGLFPGAADPWWMAGVSGDLELPYKDTGVHQIRPYAGHGAFCAGTVRTVAPKAAVHVENAFEVLHTHPDGSVHDHGAGAAYESDLADQAVEALQRGPDILCLAFGTPTRAQLAPLGFETLRQMVEQRKGIVVVAAAGCDGSREPFWPAATPWTLSVGSLDAGGRARAPWSNFGGWVDVYVPGENLVNVFPSGEYVCTEPPDTGQVRTFAGLASWSGTSFSCALMGGLIAARMSATGENAPQAAQSLLALARAQALPGVGSVLYPGQGCTGC